MKLGIMQPYFFPYLGYFSLIKNTDKWIVLDTVQYIRHGWINRNRVLKPNEGWQYIGVPLKKHCRNTLISDVKILKDSDWEEKIIRQLEHYKKAPYYNQVIKLLRECFLNKTDNITKFNTYSLKKVCEYLNIEFDYEIFSEMNLKIDKINNPGEWALKISKALKANEYMNPPSGEGIFDKKKFKETGIKLNFLQINSREYNQRGNKFEPYLSIIDVMMFNSPQKINGFLDNYKLL